MSDITGINGNSAAQSYKKHAAMTHVKKTDKQRAITEQTADREGRSSQRLQRS